MARDAVGRHILRHIGLDLCEERSKAVRVVQVRPLPVPFAQSVFGQDQRGWSRGLGQLRAMRPGEVEGKDYHFLELEDFLRHRDEGDFVESFEVYGRGHWYGTLREQVSTGLIAGNWISLEIDVEGAQKAKQSYPDAISVFIHPGSLEELERRLRGRGTEQEDAIARRLEVASHELEAAVLYDHVVVNQTIEQTVEDICQLLIQSSDSTIEKS